MGNTDISNRSRADYDLLHLYPEIHVMLDWIRAYGLAIYHGPGWAFMAYVFPWVMGALVGATLGSVGKWYVARWQVGMLAGLWIGGQYAFLGVSHGTPWPFRDWQQVLQIVGILAMAVGLMGSALSGWWFSVSNSYWTRFFRDRSGRWLRHRGLHALAVATLLISIPVSAVLFEPGIRHFQKILPYYDDYQTILKKWEPYEAWLTGELGQSLSLIVRTRSGLSDESLALIEEAPWPVKELSIFGSTDIRDIDLINAVPRLAQIQRITMLNSPLSDECLPVIANCRKLKFLDVNNCQGITAEGLKQFHQLRPDIYVRHNGRASGVIVDGQWHFEEKFELELLPREE